MCGIAGIVGSGQGADDLAGRMRAMRDRLVHRGPDSRFGRRARDGDIRHSSARITAAERDLGWRPTVSFEEGIDRTIAWYRERATSTG